MSATKVTNRQINVTSDFDINSHKLTNLADPTSASDAATKAYVDAAIQGLDVKQSVRVATTANITLSGTQTIDGVALSAGNRVLVKDQTDQTANGLYVVAAGSWARSTDADSNSEVTAGLFVFVEEGTTNGDTGWVLTADGTITLGSSNITFAQFNGGGMPTAGAGLTKTGSQLDVVSANGGIVVNPDNIALTVANASLAITSGGIKIPDATAGQVITANGSGVPVAQTLSGDIASIDGSGNVTLATTVLKTSMINIGVTPSGSINGSNTAFTLSPSPQANTEILYLNGVRLQRGAGNDYTIAGASITMATAPVSGDILLADFWS